MRFLPRTIDEDQWQSADRAIYWLWSEFGAKKAKSRKAPARAEGAKPQRQHHRARSTAPSTCRPTWPRSGAWSRASAARSTSSSRWAAHIEDMPKLADADVNVCMYREFGRKLCEELDKPYLQAPIGLFATTNFLRKLGELTGVDPEPFIEREKHTTIKPIWDLWRSRHPGLLRHGLLRDRRDRHLRRAACSNFLEEEMGVPCAFAFSRKAGVKPDNAKVREALQARRRRWSCSAPTTSACTRPSWARRCDLHPGLVPGRHHPPRHRHAVHGLCRRHLHRPGILQRAVRRAVPHPAARHRARPGRGDAGAARADDQPVGRRRAARCSTRWSRREPFLVRISAAKRLRDRAERDARAGRRGAGDRGQGRAHARRPRRGRAA